MQRDCRMCRTVEQNAVDEASGGRLLPPVADRGDEEARIDPNSRTLLPSRRLSRHRGPFGFLSSPCFLPPFLRRCRPVSPVNIASHVVSEGFCESADDCRRVICRFLAWRQPHRERKRAGSDGYGTKRKREKEREMWSRFTVARSPLRCYAGRAQHYKWPRCYAYPNRSRTQRYVEEREKKEKIFIKYLRVVSFVT